VLSVKGSDSLREEAVAEPSSSGLDTTEPPAQWQMIKQSMRSGGSAS